MKQLYCGSCILIIIIKEPTLFSYFKTGQCPCKKVSVTLMRDYLVNYL